MALTNIALLGANGTLGPHILSSSLHSTHPKFSITVLSRASSKSTYPSTVTVTTIPDDPTLEDYTTALKDIDVLITTIAGTQSKTQITLADACIEAGVKLFIPADFGSCDSSSQLALDTLPIYRAKAKVRAHLTSLAEKNQGFVWTSIVCGHFFEYGLTSKPSLFFTDVPKWKVTVFDGGDIKFSATTLPQVGRAVVSVIKNADDERVRNKMVYIHSFTTTQNKLLAMLAKVTGSQWKREDKDSKQFLEKGKEMMQSGKGSHEIIEELVGVLGMVDADWTNRGERFVNEALGLEEEDVEEQVRKALKGPKSGMWERGQANDSGHVTSRRSE